MLTFECSPEAADAGVTRRGKHKTKGKLNKSMVHPHGGNGLPPRDQPGTIECIMLTFECSLDAGDGGGGGGGYGVAMKSNIS